MERFKQLLDELNQLAAQGSAPELLQQAVARLSFELSKELGSANKTLGTAKVAVVLPQQPVQFETGADALQQTVDPIHLSEDVPMPTPKSKERSKSKSTPLVLFDEEFVVEPIQSVGPSHTMKPDSAGYDVMEEVPTLYMHRGVELNEQLKTIAPSLNDQLKAAAPERQDLLREGPIQDLTKAIGVNERFQFIRELFRNDEVMYERSIKTINQFKVYPEAEFWINRELKTKLGWPIGHSLVQQFDQLVKRRFS